MSKRVLLVRHGESEANANEIWQGASSSPLTARGRQQAELAGPRLAGRRFDLVESSDLERSLHTAEIAGFRPRVLTGWREGDIGVWEGRPGEWVQAHYGHDLARLNADYDTPMGETGESPRQVSERGLQALTGLLGRLEDGQTGLVFTHGGLIEMVLWRMLGLPTGRRRIGFLSNSSFCELAFDGSDAVLVRYNDAAHLGPESFWAGYVRDGGGGVVVDLIRHGVTQANLERRAQGRMDSDLHPEGRRQARRLKAWIGEVDEVFSSPLTRAATTAEIGLGRQPVLVDELMEMSFGEWEGELWEELEASGRLGGYPRDGRDVRRGGTGETWSEVQDRVAGFVGSLSDSCGAQRVAAASHGGAIKAYATRILGLEYGKTRLLGPLENTSVTQVAITPDGHPMLTTYNVTAHLEG